MMRTIRGSFWKHPRLSGEDRPREALEHPGTETPPLTRGRPHSAQSRLRSPWKHPQLRGEDFCTCPTLIALIETPPLTRGRLCALQRNLPADGNTPAYAGKTRRRRPSAKREGKHPRLRGEDLREREHAVFLPETPPLTRGRLRLVGRASRRARNTPAYAGKTVMEGVFPPDRTKHPRLRGEDIPVPGDVPTIGETPPLTRGRPGCHFDNNSTRRNTPAYAGKTST